MLPSGKVTFFLSRLKNAIRPLLGPSVVGDVNGNTGRRAGDYLWGL